MPTALCEAGKLLAALGQACGVREAWGGGYAFMSLLPSCPLHTCMAHFSCNWSPSSLHQAARWPLPSPPVAKVMDLPQLRGLACHDRTHDWDPKQPLAIATGPAQPPCLLPRQLQLPLGAAITQHRAVASLHG